MSNIELYQAAGRNDFLVSPYTFPSNASATGHKSHLRLIGGATHVWEGIHQQNIKKFKASQRCAKLDKMRVGCICQGMSGVGFADWENTAYESCSRNGGAIAFTSLPWVTESCC